MRLILILSIFSLTLLYCCNTDAIDNQQYINDEGIFVEVIDSINDGKPNLYNKDNKIYTPGREFIFTYSFITKEGQECWFSREGYGIKSKDSLTTKTIAKLSIVAKENNTFLATTPDYNQTILEYRYYLYNDSLSWPLENSGLIENAMNVWMHPWRRSKYFYYLQLNPYPFIKKPFKIGNSWDWEFKVGDQWGYEEWATWQGNLDIHHHYEIIDKKTISAPFKDQVLCYVVKATGKNSIGKTELTSYFSAEYGFIKFEYLNIDSSQVIIELEEIRKVNE